MIEELTPWTPKVTVSEGVTLDDLTITFRRTIRVPDNKNTSGLPPDQGAFPLFKIQDYARTFPLSMAQKGGMFIPMYLPRPTPSGSTSETSTSSLVSPTFQIIMRLSFVGDSS
ncbi:hypothetical protein LB505_014126 [Fusarium chuoi]|nr:hypothetical protein LB505_014126 [Fusarium chuoi]